MSAHSAVIAGCNGQIQLLDLERIHVAVAGGKGRVLGRRVGGDRRRHRQQHASCNNDVSSRHPDLPVSLFVSSKFRANRRAVRPRKAFRQVRSRVGDVNASLQANLSSVREAQAFNREDQNIQTFSESNAASRDASIRAVAYTSALQPTLEALGYITRARNDYDRRRVPVVRPGAPEPVVAGGTPATASWPGLAQNRA